MTDQGTRAVVNTALGVDRSLLSDQVYMRLRDQILDRALEPGARIVEYEIARQYGVSQAPVRDALRRLAHEGLVEQFARRGTFVTEVSEAEARQTYEIRAALEPLAAQEFIANAPPEALAALDRLLAEMRAAAARDDVSALVHADAEFHRTVWEGTQNVLLPRIWPMVEANFRRMTAVSNRKLFPNLTVVAESHAPLLDGLRNRDEAIGELFRQHIMSIWT